MDIKPIQASFQMVGSTVRHLNIENNFISISNDADTERAVDVSYEIDNKQEFDDEHLMFGVSNLSTHVKIKKAPLETTISLIVQGCFSIPKEEGKEKLKEMMSLSGSAALYSISRAIISGISAQCYTSGSIVLPMINVIKMKELNDAAPSNN